MKQFDDNTHASPLAYLSQPVPIISGIHQEGGPRGIETIHAIKCRFLTTLRFILNDNRYYYSLRRPKMTLFGKLCRRR